MIDLSPSYPHTLTRLPSGAVHRVRWHEDDLGQGLILVDSHGTIHDLSDLAEDSYALALDGYDEAVTRSDRIWQVTQ